MHFAAAVFPQPVRKKSAYPGVSLIKMGGPQYQHGCRGQRANIPEYPLYNSSQAAMEFVMTRMRHQEIL